MKKKIKLSDFVAQFLSQYVNRVFVGQGSSVIHILDSVDKRKDINNVPSQNEQGAALAADAYSRLTGNIGVSIATSGPGIINLLQGIGCSYFDSVPHLIISGAVPVPHMRNNKKIRQIGFQEMEVVDIVKPITKYATLLKNPNRVKYELQKLVYYSKQGRPGPVLIDLPDDLQRTYIDVKKLKSFKPPKNKTKNNITSIKKALSMISKAKRPLIIYGNGIKIAKAEKELNQFIKKTNIPFAPTWATHDLYNHDKKNLVGIFGVAASRYGNFTIQSADLLICLGTRLNYQLTGAKPETFAPFAKKIVVDIDATEFTKNKGPKIDLKINSCVKDFLKVIISKNILNNKKILKSWVSWIQKTKKKYPLCKKKYYLEKKFVNPYVFFNELSNITNAKDIIIPDASANLIWAYQAFKPKKGQQIFTSLNHSPMGYSVAASVGAQYAKPNKRIIAIIGDGSFQMNVQELETISYNKLPVKIFIINNQGYGLIKGTQELFLKKNYVGVDSSSGLGLPDFKKIAYSYNINYCSIKNHNELRKKIRFAVNSKNTIICDVFVDPKQRVIPKLESGQPIHNLSPLLSLKELESNLLNI